MGRRIYYLGIFLSLVAVFALPVLAEESAATSKNTGLLELSDKARRDLVLLEGKGIKVTVGEIEDEVAKAPEAMHALWQDPQRLMAFAETRMRFKLLAKEALSRDYDKDPDVQHNVKQHAVQALIQGHINRKISKESISVDAIATYYREHQKDYHRPAMVRAHHILLKSRPKAVTLIKRLQESDVGAFAEAAREHSIDNETKLRGGDLRYFDEKGQPGNKADAPVDTTLAKAAFSLKTPGDITSKPVAVGEFWSIVKLTGRRPAYHKSLEAAQEEIRSELWRQRRKASVEAFVTDQYKKKQVKIHTDRLKWITLDEKVAKSDGDP